MPSGFLSTVAEVPNPESLACRWENVTATNSFEMEPATLHLRVILLGLLQLRGLAMRVKAWIEEGKDEEEKETKDESEEAHAKEDVDETVSV